MKELRLSTVNSMGRAARIPHYSDLHGPFADYIGFRELFLGSCLFDK